MGIDHHIISKISDVLDRVAHSGVAIKGQSRELLGNSHFRMSSVGGESKTLIAESVEWLCSLAFAIHF